MSAVVTTCPSCRGQLAPGARFCAGCGTRVAAPISWDVASRRTFGVLPGRSRMRAVHARSSRWVAVIRARLHLALVLVAARIDALGARLRVGRHAAVLARERAKCLTALGAAVHEGDEAAAERVKLHLRELDAGIAGARDELRRVDEWMRFRIAEARRDDGATVAGEQVPTPVPEPGPVPSPQPGPVIVPEPEPAPHEPRGPVVVPDPSPVPEPDPAPPSI